MKGEIHLEFNFITILLLFIGGFLLYLVGKMEKMENDIKGIKSTIDLISKQVGVPEDPVHEELQQLLDEGNEVKAVKRARETLGLSLLEAKKYIDALKQEGK